MRVAIKSTIIIFTVIKTVARMCWEVEAVWNIWLHIDNLYYAAFVRIKMYFLKPWKSHVITKYNALGSKRTLTCHTAEDDGAAENGTSSADADCAQNC